MDYQNFRAMRAKAYNTRLWRKTREAYLREHPLCERCLAEGVVYGGNSEDPIQVHHKKSPFTSEGVDLNLMYDMKNLETICSKHHGLEHTHTESNYETIKKLEDILK